jgi:adenylate cyclase
MAADRLDDPDLYADLEGEEREARRELLEHLVGAGATQQALKDAAREDRLATMPVEFALGSGRRYTVTEVARRAGLRPDYVRSLMLALGYPNPRPREKLYTDEDVEVAKIHRRFLDAGLPREGTLDVARVLGQSMSRAAAAIRLMAGDALIKPGDTESTLGLRYAAAAEELVPLLGPVLDQQLRMHLREQATRDVVTAAHREAGSLAGEREVAVCFADLTGFTRLGEHLSADHVGSIGSRMTVLATEVACPPVDLVKTIGDGAMLVSADVDALLDAAVGLSERAAKEGDEFPPVRAGIAYGRAVHRGGDWFGPAVNRASRLVDAAKPGTILVEETAQQRAAARFTWAKRRRKNLRGIDGRTHVYRLERERERKGV